VLGDHRGLGHGYPLATNENQRVRGTEVDREVASPAQAQAPSPRHLVCKR
jgi:hypothetical protein